MKNNLRMIRFADSIQTYLEDHSNHYPFELGEMIVGENNVIYSFSPQHLDFFQNAVEKLNYFSNIKGKGKVEESMYKDFEKFIPKYVKSFDEDDGSHVLVLSKSKEDVLLKEVFNYFKGSIDPKHVAWILSSIYNFVCFLKVSGITHNDISMNNYFVDLENHSGYLLGGWWYSCYEGKKMIGVNGRTFNNMPQEIKELKAGDYITDLYLVKALGRELVGDLSKIPERFRKWLVSTSTGDALTDYQVWQEDIIENSFGGRFFTEIDKEVISKLKGE